MTGIEPLREVHLNSSSARAVAPIDCGGVPRPETTRNLVLRSRAKTVIFLAFVLFLFAIVGLKLSRHLQGTDFPDFYCAARMILDGHGHQLYNSEFQHEYQARLAGGIGTLYAHPPFEAILYFVVAWLPLEQAYLLWFVLNLAFLTLAVRRVTAEVLRCWDWRLALAASLTFAPVLLCLLQGQDSLLFLLVVALAFSALRSERAFAAGCWLGFGLCKFQIVLPLVLVLLLVRKSKSKSELARGFGLVALAVALFSAAISGWSVFMDYPRFLLSLQTHASSGVAPQVMANFRGLVYLLLHADRSWASIAAVLILSASALIKPLTEWRRAQTPVAQTPVDAHDSASMPSDFDIAFASTILFGLLVSYYLNPHDVSLLLLPLSVLLRFVAERILRLSRPTDWITVALLGALFLPPLHLWALKAHVYAIVAIPILFLFLISGPGVERGGPALVDT